MKIFFRPLVLIMAMIFSGYGLVYGGVTDTMAYMPDNTDSAIYINYADIFSYLKSGGINPDDYLLIIGDVESVEVDEALKRFKIKISDVKELLLAASISGIASQSGGFLIIINTGGKGVIPDEFKEARVESEYGALYMFPDGGPMEVCFMQKGDYFIIGDKPTVLSYLKKMSMKVKGADGFNKSFTKGCSGKMMYMSIVISEVVKQALETAVAAGAGANMDILQANLFIKAMMSVKSMDASVEMKNGFEYNVGMYGVSGEDAERLVMVSHFGIVSSSFIFTFAEMLSSKTDNQNLNAVFGDRENLAMMQQILGRATVKKTADSVIVSMNVTKDEADRSLAGLKTLIDQQKQARAERMERVNISKLTEAIINNDTDTAEKMIPGIKNVNIKDMNGDYPVAIAAMYGNMKILKALVAKGAKIDLPGSNGNTPLHLAVSAGMFDAVVYLVEKGAAVNARNDEGMSPLYINSSQGDTKITMFLLKKGAQVNAVSGDGYAPIHRAAESGNLEVIKVLVKYKADVELVSGYQERAIDIASRNGFDDIVNYFKTTFRQAPVENTYEEEDYDNYNSDTEGDFEEN